MERRPTDSDVMPAAVSDTSPKKARLPPEGRLAFVNAVKPEIARDFVLSCLSDDVGALIALVHASPAIRDLVAAQLTRLTCSGRVMCFVGANLLELDVSRRAGAERDGLADAGIRAIAERCPNLRSFSAANRGRVRDGATALAHKCPQLERVNINGTSASAASIVALAERCKNLRALHVGGDAPGVCDEGLQTIGAHCKQLATLTLGTKATDAGIVAVAKGCTALTHLCLDHCENVTDTAVAAIAKHRGETLVELGLGGCHRVTRAAKIELAKRCPKLRGHLEARCVLAWQYGEGIGGKERDRAKAAMHYRLCAEQGHKIAQNNLGNAYYLGDGVARDPARAAYWFEKAATQGYKLAQCNLGGMYAHGAGIERNAARAAYWYGKAAAQGDEEAKGVLARGTPTR